MHLDRVLMPWVTPLGLLQQPYLCGEFQQSEEAPGPHWPKTWARFCPWCCVLTPTPSRTQVHSTEICITTDPHHIPWVKLARSSWRELLLAWRWLHAFTTQKRAVRTPVAGSLRETASRAWLAPLPLQGFALSHIAPHQQDLFVMLR